MFDSQEHESTRLFIALPIAERALISLVTTWLLVIVVVKIKASVEHVWSGTGRENRIEAQVSCKKYLQKESTPLTKQPKAFLQKPVCCLGK